MTYKNKLVDTNDSVDFGVQKGEPYKWIFLLDTSYFVWLIENTDICFTNLNLFHLFGNPIIIDENKISREEIHYLSNLCMEIGINQRSTGSPRYKVTVEILANAIDKKIITLDHFIHKKFKFEAKTIQINNTKLENSYPYFNFVNINRDNHLKKIFKI